ncbi:EVE domain-containing protein [Aeromicrobium sp.]|nr:EVE domain-containing protein [Candidatus Saccharibacteria bacterium]
MTHWLLVSSPANFETSRGRGFDVAGMKKRWAKAASEVRPGDTVFFYATGLKAIAGEAVATGEAYFDETVIWESTKLGEYYPHRFPVDLVKAREADEYLPVETFLTEYENARKWPAKNWTLAFQGNVHRLNDHDYKLIHDLL